jgi:hypothetical protein
MCWSGWRSYVAAPAIQIGPARREATDPAARIGTTLFGPGWPGNSGVALTRQGETNWPHLL